MFRNLNFTADCYISKYLPTELNPVLRLVNRKWYKRFDVSPKSYIFLMLFVAKNGFLRLFSWLNKQGCPLVKHARFTAIIHGHNDIAKWFYLSGKQVLYLDYNAAASQGNTEMLAWFETFSGSNYISPNVTNAGLGSFSHRFPLSTGEKILTTLLWLKAYNALAGKEFTNNKTFYYAVKLNHPHLLDFLYQEQCPMNEDYFITAAESRAIKSIQWLEGHNFVCKISEELEEAVIYSRQVEVLSWGESKGISFTMPLDWATNLDLFQWYYTYHLRHHIPFNSGDIASIILQDPRTNHEKNNLRDKDYRIPIVDFMIKEGLITWDKIHNFVAQISQECRYDRDTLGQILDAS